MGLVVSFREEGRRGGGGGEGRTRRRKEGAKGWERVGCRSGRSGNQVGRSG
jgi:hypothetical protein